MTDVSKEQILGRLRDLKMLSEIGAKSASFQHTESEKANSPKSYYAAATIGGLLFGLAAMQTTQWFMDKQCLSRKAMDWVILEISENRDMTPLAARNLLNQKIEALQ